MKRSGLIVAIVAVMFSVLIALTGCDDKTEENRKNKENIINKVQTEKQTGEEHKVEKGTLKDGIYTFVAESEDEEMLEESVSIELKDGKIILSDGFAGLVQEGTYKVDGGKLIGNYYSMTYIDHSNGGEYTTKEINDKIEIYILSDGALRDVIGYGISLNNTMCTGALYKLSEQN